MTTFENQIDQHVGAVAHKAATEAAGVQKALVATRITLAQHLQDELGIPGTKAWEASAACELYLEKLVNVILGEAEKRGETYAASFPQALYSDPALHQMAAEKVASDLEQIVERQRREMRRKSKAFVEKDDHPDRNDTIRARVASGQTTPAQAAAAVDGTLVPKKAVPAATAAPEPPVQADPVSAMEPETKASGKKPAKRKAAPRKARKPRAKK